MKLPISYRSALILLLVGLPVLGCAKKAPTPAQPPPTSANETPPTPSTTPAPTHEETAPTPSSVESGDFSPVFFDLDSLEHLASESLVAGPDIRQVEIRGHVREQRQKPVAHVMPEQQDAVGASEESRAVDDVRLAPFDWPY